jgi:hypothetical protein
VRRLEIDRPPRPSGVLDQDPREVHGERLSGRIRLDNTSFEACAFQSATLVYAGGVPPSIQNCSFQGVTFEFEGAAAHTLSFLQAMTSRSSGFRDLFRASFPKLFAH